MSQDQTNGKLTQIETEMMLEKMESYMPAQLEMTKLHAQILRTKFLALKAEGFSHDEALQIVKARPLFDGNN